MKLRIKEELSDEREQSKKYHEMIEQYNDELTKQVIDSIIGTNKVILGFAFSFNYKLPGFNYLIPVQRIDKYGKNINLWYKIIRQTSQFYVINFVRQYQNEPERTPKEIREYIDEQTAYVKKDKLIQSIKIFTTFNSPKGLMDKLKETDYIIKTI